MIVLVLFGIPLLAGIIWAIVVLSVEVMSEKTSLKGILELTLRNLQTNQRLSEVDYWKINSAVQRALQWNRSCWTKNRHEFMAETVSRISPNGQRLMLESLPCGKAKQLWAAAMMEADRFAQWEKDQ